MHCSLENEKRFARERERRGRWERRERERGKVIRAGLRKRFSSLLASSRGTTERGPLFLHRLPIAL